VIKRLFPNWTTRCLSRWLTIGGIVAMLSGVAIAATHAKTGPVAGFGTSPSVCKPGTFCPPPPPPTSFALTLGVPVPEPEVDPAPVEPDNGFGPSPSAPATNSWYAAAALFLIPLIGAAKKNARVKKFFSTDGLGSLSSFVVAFVYTFGEALARGETPTLVLAKHALGLTAAMFLGYAGIYKRIALPLLRQLVTKVFGLSLPGWLAETARVENVTVVGTVHAEPHQSLSVKNSTFLGAK
jgi:hypothetical protein